MSVKKIGNFQIKLLQICKNYLTSQKKKNVNISTSPLCFFTVWAETPGYYQILNLSKLDQKTKLIYIFKNLISISKNYNFNILKISHSIPCS